MCNRDAAVKDTAAGGGEYGVSESNEGGCHKY